MSVKTDIDVILDTFGGADGGVSFAKLNFYLLGLEKKTVDQMTPSEIRSAEDILLIVTRFARLCNIVGFDGKYQDQRRE